MNITHDKGVFSNKIKYKNKRSLSSESQQRKDNAIEDVLFHKVLGSSVNMHNDIIKHVLLK